MSTQGTFIYAKNSTHAIPNDEPEVVINAVHYVVEAALARIHLPTARMFGP
jgi:hypothetical protein